MKYVQSKHWEHSVTYPLQDFVYNKLDGEIDDQIIVNKEKNIPVVILHGWAGCTDNYLRYYSKIYEDRGLITIRYVCPVKYIFFENNSMIRIGEEMVEPLEKGNFEDRPIIFHILSNGGAYQYEVYTKALKKGPFIKQVKGVILDSVPARRSVIALYKAIKPNVKSGYFQIPRCASLTAYCASKRYLEMKYAELLKKECVQMNPFENLKNEVNKWPQHFIYSTADKIIPYQNVEKFMRHRKSLGIDFVPSSPLYATLLIICFIA
ncbi:hypothetical protein HHI36_021394 [Cryptolaemus montrouzieri]|uniref:Uncharacterized protein n=1 Tax=Cryptolaemus montrouzieri TaxID=559131 RepID=A0ABD2MWT8_9CUCU